MTMTFSEACNIAVLKLHVAWNYAYNYVDVYYMSWLMWLFYPLLVTFILPIVIFILVYLSSLFLHLYGLRHHIRTALHDAYRGEVWDGARHILAALWDAQGKIWHGMLIIILMKYCIK